MTNSSVKRKVLITGTAGFIGFHLAKLLLEGEAGFMGMMESPIIMM